MKVYCSECKYVIESTFFQMPNYEIDRCKCVKRVVNNPERDTPARKIPATQTFVYCEPKIDNINNSCRFFEKKLTFKERVLKCLGM